MYILINFFQFPLNFPLKCFICKNMIEKNEVQKHECFCNYPNICVDENGDLCPQLGKQLVFIWFQYLKCRLNEYNFYFTEDGTIVYEPTLSCTKSTTHGK